MLLDLTAVASITRTAPDDILLDAPRARNHLRSSLRLLLPRNRLPLGLDPLSPRAFNGQSD